MFCPKCGHTLQPDARFCAACGEPAPVITGAGAPAAGFEPDATMTTRLSHLPPPPVEAPQQSGWSAGTASGPQTGGGFPSGAPPAAWPPPAYSAPPPPSGAGRSRSPLLIGGALLVVLVLVVLGVMLPKLLESESQLGEVATLDGTFRAEIRSGQTTEPKRKWKVDASGADSAVVGDDLFFGVEDESDPKLVARSVSDGKEKWQADLPSGGTVGLSEDVLFVSVATSSGKGELRSYDPDSGELRWETTVDAPIAYVNRYDDRLLADLGDELVAVDIDDGKEAWSEGISGSLSAVDDDRVYVVSGTDVKAVALDDGDKAWTTDAGGDVTSVAVADGRAVVGVGSDAIGLARDDGKEEWKTDLDLGDVTGIINPQGSTVVVVGSDDVGALDAGSGERLEGDSFRADKDDWQGYGFRMPDGRLIIAGGDFTKLHSIDPETGRSGGSLDIEDRSFSGIGTSSLYVNDEDTVFAYRVDDLEEQWSIDADNVGEVVAGDGLVVLVTGDGYELWT